VVTDDYVANMEKDKNVNSSAGSAARFSANKSQREKLDKLNRSSRNFCPQ